MSEFVESLKRSLTPNTWISRQTALRRPRRDENHCTWLGNQRLYSLSRVLRDLGLKPDYGATDPAVIHRAACRGKLTEDYCYRLLMGKAVTVRAKHTGSLQADVSVRTEAFFRWMQKYKPEYVDSQSFVWSAEDRVCWQRDLRVRISGHLWLIDIKCTSKPEKDWPLQLGCGLSYDEDQCDDAAILHLNPKLNQDGFRFIDKWTGAQLKSCWRIAIDHWKSRYAFTKMTAALGFDSEAIGFEVEDGGRGL